MLLLARSEAARRLGMSETTLRRLEKEGRLHPLRPSFHMVRYTEDELRRFVEEISRGNKKAIR